ncbi:MULTISPECIES: hypothetical protein [unclassified Streptomyces]|uniref:hypothetical protein n=1 Tax=unclassified Streptomyces TaxID=2593676 RepID=UPI00163C276B|nr:MULTISPECIES: hypothetical protein [unclassified Streptomyces]
MPQAAPGQSTALNVEVRSLGDRPVNPGTVRQGFTAPTGFAFNPVAAYGYYYVSQP